MTKRGEAREGQGRGREQMIVLLGGKNMDLDDCLSEGNKERDKGIFKLVVIVHV